jgi:radical SAM superfamily enzyme YgiQ (UPF0313 family)
MVDKKKICFIFPRMEYPSGDFSLGIASIAGYLRTKFKDLDITLIDTSFNPSFDNVSHKLKKINPDIVAIYADTLMLNDALKCAKFAKQIGANVIFGGPHVTLFPKEVLKNKSVDVVSIGEGEITFEKYINQFFSKKIYSEINGLGFKKKDKLIINKPASRIKDLDLLGMPAYDLFNVNKYKKMFFQLDSHKMGLKGISIIASRGCPFQCTYCQPTNLQVLD